MKVIDMFIPVLQPAKVTCAVATIIGCISQLGFMQPDLQAAEHQQLFVAVDGNDANEGSEAQPLRSIQGAVRLIEKLFEQDAWPAGGVQVVLRQGTYAIHETIVFDARFKTSATAPLIFTSFENECVQISGGWEIPASAFRPVSDAKVRQRIIEEAARGKVVEADLVQAGMPLHAIAQRQRTGQGVPVVPAASELFFDDRPMKVARWPNDGYERIARVVRPSSSPHYRRSDSETPTNEGPAYIPGIFEYVGDRPSRWTNAREVWLEGYWTFDWAEDCMPISYIDTANRQITLSAPHAYGMGGVLGQGDRYFALNLLEEIDQPGEYYIDPYVGRLYFFPPEQITDQRVVISALEGPIFALNHISHVVFRGLTFEAGRSVAVEVAGGEQVRIEGCQFRNMGGWAVKVNGGQQHAVLSCDIHDVGRGGIQLIGGDQRTLRPAGHQAVNNHIHHYSRLAKTYQFAIALQGVGNRVANNLIHDAPHCAMDWRGNLHEIERNIIHDVCLDTNDAGAIQTDRDLSTCGNMIRHNIFHHIGGATSKGNILGVFSVYLDSNASGDTFFGNVFYRGGERNIIHVNGGRDVKVENNVFVEGGAPVEITSVGLTAPFRPVLEIAWSRLLEKVNHTEPPWSTTFPHLLKYPSNMDALAIPEGNSICRNLFYRTKDVKLQFDEQLSKDIVEIKYNYRADSDPFLDLADLDFRFKDPELIQQEIPGFQPIPFEDIGLFVDDFRTALPANSR